MKRTIIISAALLALTGVQAQQNDIEQVLRHIEANNKELQANAQLLASQKLEVKSDNNLPDPTLSYAHLWGAKEKSETIGELVVSQSFDFPTLYFSRNRLSRLKSNSFDSRADLFRQEILLQAKEMCLDIIMLRRQREILNERLRNAEDLSKIYEQRLNMGSTNSIEANKIKLELLNVRTETALNETALQNKICELNALNGDIPVVFETNQYPEVPFPVDYQVLKSEIITADRTLLAMRNESLAARKQIAVNRSQWLPKLEFGYRRNTESAAPFNGVVVGFSFPLFENRNKVKIAKAQSLNIDLQKDNTTIQIESQLSQSYQEAKTLYRSMEEYHNTFKSQQTLSLLKQALDEGQLSMISYFAELSVVYQSRTNVLQLENQYQKAMAKIYKGKL